MPIIPSGGGAVAGNSVLLYDFTITGADAASIDTNVDGTMAGALSGAYKILEVFFTGRTDEAVIFSGIHFTFNNDSSSIYDRGFISSSLASSTPVAGNDINNAALFGPSMLGSSATAGSVGYATMVIHNYAATVFSKIVHWMSGAVNGIAGNGHRVIISGIESYKTTTAISRIAVIPDTGGKKLIVGSRLTIYGR